MSDVAVISLCILITMMCLGVAIGVSVYNFRKVYKLIRKDMKEEREKRELEELEVLKEIE